MSKEIQKSCFDFLLVAPCPLPNRPSCFLLNIMSKEIQKSWFDFLDQVHKTLQNRGLERVETPTLVECPGTEADLDFFEISLSEKSPISSAEKPLASFTENPSHNKPHSTENPSHNKPHSTENPSYNKPHSTENLSYNKPHSAENPSHNKPHSTKNPSHNKPHSTENPSHNNSTENLEVKKLFLASSPEMYLKQLLCAGWTDIYEIKKCFRKGESGPVNHSEFYLLEWYRAHSGLEALVEDLQTLLNTLSYLINSSPAPTPTVAPRSTASTSTPSTASAPTSTVAPRSTTPTPSTAPTNPTSTSLTLCVPKIEKISMKTLFKKHLNMDLTPHSSQKDFQRELKKRNIPFSEGQDIDDAFHLLFLNEIEPRLNKDIPTLVYNFPPFQKAYARIGSEGWALRFELFWKGMELANAFDEVIDAKEQEKCFKEDNLKRHKKGKPIIPPDSKLLDAMRKKQMPPSAGIALGLDRLFLAFTGLKNINQIRFFT